MTLRRSPRWIELISVFLAAAVVGCSGAAANDAGSTSGETGGGGHAGGASSSGGSGGDSSSSGGSGVASFADADGMIEFIDQNDSSDTFGAAFSKHAPISLYGSGCSESALGDHCYVSRCDLGGTHGPLPKYLDAGVLTLRGGIYGQGLTVSPSSNNAYGYQEPTNKPSFAPGDLLRVSASGAELPAFSEEITGAACVDVTSPPSSGGAYTFSLSHDLAVAWHGGQSGQTVFVALIRQSDQEARALECLFDAASGEGTLSTEMIAQVDVTGSNIESFLAVGQTQIKLVSIGGLKVFITAPCNIVQPADTDP